MSVRFVVNDYVLIWNLLFGASISETIYKLKQKIWDAYRREYNDIFKDKDQIMNDYKNFIPNNDTIYNIVMENKDYEKLRKQAEKYRIEVMQLWDSHKKETDYLYQKIIRKDYNVATIFIVNPELRIIEFLPKDNLLVGKTIDKKDSIPLLLDIQMEILKNKVKKYQEEDEMFCMAILELAVSNEYATRITGRSSYHSGTPSLLPLKRALYPYWLMYLGVSKEELLSRMMSDKMDFQVENYAYEKQLKRLDIEEFIDFCIRNKRYIVRDNNVLCEVL